MVEFRSTSVFKRDLFSETQHGFLVDRPETPVIRRKVTAAPWATRPLAWVLARREIAALGAVEGIRGVPSLIATDADGLMRTFTVGVPLHIARPENPEWYRDARRLVRLLRRRGITHNDLAKPQNWLVTPDGRAAVIDFQLAMRHRRRGLVFRLMAYEDLRHAIKQMHRYAPHLMTPSQRRLLDRRSLPSRIWLASGKRVYNLITRGVFGWSDREGAGERMARESATVAANLRSHPEVRDVVLAPFPMPRRGVGLYAFVETDGKRRLTLRNSGADLVQPVTALPRRADGTPREDILTLIATNQMSGLDTLIGEDRRLAATVAPIAQSRLNLTDRRLPALESGRAS